MKALALLLAAIFFVLGILYGLGWEIGRAHV